REPLLLYGHGAEIVHLDFSNGGDLLVSTAWDNITRLWDPWTGRQLVSAPHGGVHARFGPDDRRLGGPGTGTCQLWEVATGRECRTLHGHATGYKGPWGLDFSPNGNLLASAGNDGVQLWDVAGGRNLAFLPVARAQTVLFGPRGQSVITCG